MTAAQARKADTLLTDLGVRHSLGTFLHAGRASAVVTLHLPHFNPKFNKYSSVLEWIAVGCPDLDCASVERFR